MISRRFAFSVPVSGTSHGPFPRRSFRFFSVNSSAARVRRRQKSVGSRWLTSGPRILYPRMFTSRVSNACDDGLHTHILHDAVFFHDPFHRHTPRDDGGFSFTYCRIHKHNAPTCHDCCLLDRPACHDSRYGSFPGSSGSERAPGSLGSLFAPRACRDGWHGKLGCDGELHPAQPFDGRSLHADAVPDCGRRTQRDVSFDVPQRCVGTHQFQDHMDGSE